MANLADIPDNLLDQAGPEDFIGWLNDQPMDLPAKRELAAIYRRYTQHQFTAEQWRSIINSTTPSNDGTQ